mmetsp:Transcript_119036/g.379629  ORF Transcript_119036/g.379629 Transcript_119036/m.379629 type:complete len:282 (+) Transcript_119036:2661-3506(+)
MARPRTSPNSHRRSMTSGRFHGGGTGSAPSSPSRASTTAATGGAPPASPRASAAAAAKKETCAAWKARSRTSSRKTSAEEGAETAAQVKMYDWKGRPSRSPGVCRRSARITALKRASGRSCPRAVVCKCFVEKIDRSAIGVVAMSALSSSWHQGSSKAPLSGCSPLRAASTALWGPSTARGAASPPSARAPGMIVCTALRESVCWASSSQVQSVPSSYTPKSKKGITSVGIFAPECGSMGIEKLAVLRWPCCLRSLRMPSRSWSAASVLSKPEESAARALA